MTANAKVVVAREVAETEFERMCDAHRIDTASMAENDADEWAGVKAALVRVIMSGALIVGSDGLATYTPPGSAKGLTFRRATGATYMALETYAGGKNMRNMCAAMADMTQADVGDFSKLDAPDFQICLRLGKLFLADR
jgi:hypothetical protein